MATRRQTFRLYPNKEQENKLFEARRNHAYLYNACVAHRVMNGKQTKNLSLILTSKIVYLLSSKEWVELAYMHSQSLQATVKRVDLAYGSFFQDLRGKPRFKRSVGGGSNPTAEPPYQFVIIRGGLTLPYLAGKSAVVVNMGQSP